MDTWDKHKPLLKQDRHTHYYQRENPSFSSTLLDAIYRSIDESNGEEDEEMVFCRETMRKKHINNSSNNGEGKEERRASLQKSCMNIENWMEEKVSYEKVSVRRKSMADFDKKTRKDFDPVLLNSSSSSSDSSCGGGFSSSESESVYGLSSRTSSTYTTQRPKPIRTSISAARPARYQAHADQIGYERNYAQSQWPKHEAAGSFVKTKSKALKIYGDLKKVKKPISPGGRLASFLNSLFTSGNAKKAKISSPARDYEDRKLKSAQTSTCSSASSFSRSCLSKTPSSRGKLSNGTKRSVRFYPVSVIVGEDSRPCGHKNLYENHEATTLMAAVTATRNSIHEELKFRVMNESLRVEEVARDILKNYQKKQQEQLQFSEKGEDEEDDDDDDEEEDDAASYASSDLFELDNLSAIGIERYREELPVYETTDLGTNRAIANGLIL